ncbi:hypothetical protein MLD38_006257 [Melastoma candidum]|uniref:Uncharacterized protein n=1 Tax=Melastoma candidum TaxID=119954 RepID=A0ACB9RLX9_9MYRT|nr:hypothetical protein MLD38_006257 [Melastoma candidum]
MVRALEREGTMQKSRSFHLKRILDSAGRHIQNHLNHDNEDRPCPKRTPGDLSVEKEDIGWVFDRSKDGDDDMAGGSTRRQPPSEVEMIKERFGKLLLGEDMSGGGKGVSSALALSNAITNLAASIFGEQRKLEPMPPERKTRWRKEIDWLLSVTDHIVELVPSQQTSKDGTNMEIMVTRQRNDIQMNIPALRKLDAMLIGCLDNFGGVNEFWYVSRNSEESENGTLQRDDDKWWLPTVKVPPSGLSEASRKWLLHQKESVNQVLKAAMAINAQVLSEIEIPEDYIEALPKNGRESLGDLIYKYITVEYFDPEDFLSSVDLTTEHKVLDLKDRIEASIIIWTRKMLGKEAKSPWGSAIGLEKRELFEERAETILLLIKQRFPGAPQSALDISKIQYNKDVGQSILESYSRVIESLAYTVLSRIEDVLFADSVARNPQQEKPDPGSSRNSSPLRDPTNQTSDDELETGLSAQNSMTLLDFMGWQDGAADTKSKDTEENTGKIAEDESDDSLSKTTRSSKIKKSYLERLENLSNLRSPTARN